MIVYRLQNFIAIARVIREMELSTQRCLLASICKAYKTKTLLSICFQLSFFDDRMWVISLMVVYNLAKRVFTIV